MTTPEEVSGTHALTTAEQLFCTLSAWHERVSVYVIGAGIANLAGAKCNVYAINGSQRTLLSTGKVQGQGNNEQVMMSAGQGSIPGQGDTIALYIQNPYGVTAPVKAYMVGWDPTNGVTPSEASDVESLTLTLNEQTLCTLAGDGYCFFSTAFNPNADPLSVGARLKLYALLGGTDRVLMNEIQVTADQAKISSSFQWLQNFAMGALAAVTTVQGRLGNSAVSVTGVLEGNAPVGGGGGGDSPTITSIFPDVVSPTNLVAGLLNGTMIGIRGSALTGADQGGLNGVWINVAGTHVPCLDPVVISDSQVAVIAPFGIAYGTYDVIVTTPQGTTTTTAAIEYWDELIFDDLVRDWNFTQTSGGSTVASVADLSPNNSPLVQATGAQQPAWNSFDDNASTDVTLFGGYETAQWPAGAGNAVNMRDTTLMLTEPYSVIMLGDFPTASNGVLWSGISGNFPYLDAAGTAYTMTDLTGGYTVDVTGITGTPQMVIDVRNGSSSQLWLNAQTAPIGSGNDDVAGASVGFVLGNLSANNQGPQGIQYQRVIILGHAVTQAEVRKFQTLFQGQVSPGVPPTRVNVIFSGNSITAGYFVNGIGAVNFVELAIDAFPPGVEGSNVAIAGAYTEQLLNTGITKQSLARDTLPYLCEGTNDIYVHGQTGVQAYANLLAWWEHWAAYGMTTQMTGTILPSTVFTETTEPYRLACNAAILAGATPIPGIPYGYVRTISGITQYIFDWANVPNLTDPTNATYFYTGLHLTNAGSNAGALYFVPFVKYIIEQLLAA